MFPQPQWSRANVLATNVWIQWTVKHIIALSSAVKRTLYPWRCNGCADWTAKCTVCQSLCSHMSEKNTTICIKIIVSIFYPPAALLPTELSVRWLLAIATYLQSLATVGRICRLAERKVLSLEWMRGWWNTTNNSASRSSRGKNVIYLCVGHPMSLKIVPLDRRRNFLVFVPAEICSYLKPFPGYGMSKKICSSNA